MDALDAQRRWFDPLLIEIPAKTPDEPGLLVIGSIEGKHCSAVVTPRDRATHHLCKALAEGRGGAP
ncbi:BrnT family toxin [Halomonas sp. DN3]|uniref:BrnT family toxin n=1 Tax=unclassified Halomonas TaxID=2609666 RepID=UPI00345FE2FA